MRLLIPKSVSEDVKKFGGHGRVTDKVIDSFQEYGGYAILRKTLNKMKNSCKETYFHKISTDAQPQHGLHPINANWWCKYNSVV